MSTTHKPKLNVELMVTLTMKVSVELSLASTLEEAMTEAEVVAQDMCRRALKDVRAVQMDEVKKIRAEIDYQPHKEQAYEAHDR